MISLEQWLRLKADNNIKQYSLDDVERDVKNSIEQINNAYGKEVLKFISSEKYTVAQLIELTIHDNVGGYDFLLSLYDNPFGSGLSVDKSYIGYQDDEDYYEDEDWYGVCVRFVPDHIKREVELDKHVISVTDMLIEIASGSIYARYLT